MPDGVEQVRIATLRVLDDVDDLTDDRAHDRSRLPGWSRAELITHLARNADGIRSLVEGAVRNEVVAMYPGGTEQRAAGIAAGKDAPAAALRADLRQACDQLSRAWGSLPDDGWDRVGNAWQPRTMRQLPWERRREVEIHHVDLDVGYEASDWPVGFVCAAFEEIFSTFDLRAAPSRPLVDADYRVVANDHDSAWRVALRGTNVRVEPDRGGPVDGEACGWGCDVVAWLYGRDPRAAGIMATGDLGVLRLPQWFPFG